MFSMDKKTIDSELKKLKTEADCAEFHRRFLSKDGEITKLLQSLKDIAPNKRSEMGAKFNELKRQTEEQFFKKQAEIKEQCKREKLMQDPLIDITIPWKNPPSPDGATPFTKGEYPTGGLHPITIITREIEEIFASMGFIIEDGNEIATEFENFESVNIPKDHPARDMQDTFWLSNGNVLRTHTSMWQNYMLKKYGPVFRAVAPGRCFRNENCDATHENTFFQCEGMMVGEDVSIANLIYFMKEMTQAILKRDIEIRLRPGYFPFVEPGFEMDVSCIFCESAGCGICKKSGWIELFPCGMIHPKVLEMGGVDPTKYQGFAFGFGLTRLAMIRWGIEDIRLFNSGNLEFLKGGLK